MRDARSLVPLLVPSALAAFVGAAVPPGDTGDLPYFVHAGERLWSGSWADAYADPSLQAGPLQLLAFGALGETQLIGAVVGAVVAVLFWLVARRLLGPRRWWLLAAGLAAVGVGLTFDAYRDGHPAQVIVPLLWVLAALELRAGRAWSAALLVGCSAGLETWGLLGVALLVTRPLWAFAAALVASALYLPFVLAGDFAMFEYRWHVNGDTLLSLVLEPGTAFTWQLRAVQAAAAVLVGAAVAWRLRRSPAVAWAAPLAIVVVRLALDPVRYPWYWLAVQTLALLSAVQVAASTDLARSARRLAERRPHARHAPPRQSPRTS